MEVCIVGCDGRVLAERVLRVDGVGVCGGELGIVVLEEDGDVLWGGGVDGEVGAFILVVAMVGGVRMWFSSWSTRLGGKDLPKDNRDFDEFSLLEELIGIVADVVSVDARTV